MEKNDLLIVDIGRSFLFSSLLQYIPEHGYKCVKRNLARIPKGIPLDACVQIFLDEVGIKRSANVILLTNEKVRPSRVIFDSVEISIHNLEKNISKITEKLDKKSTGYLDVGLQGVIYIDQKNSVEVRFDSKNLVDIFSKKNIFTKIGIDDNQIRNFFLYPPIPQNENDHRKSYILGRLLGENVAEKIDLSEIDSLIISSEWLKSGFLDKSGFIDGIRSKWEKVQKFSFDTTNIWKLLLNSGLERYTELQYLNKELFYSDYTVINMQKKMLNRIELEDSGEELNKQLFFVDNSQNFYKYKGKTTIKQHPIIIENNIFLVKEIVPVKKFLSKKYFHFWYKYEDTFKGKPIFIVNNESLEKEVEIDDEILSLINGNREFEYYDIFAGLKSKKDIEIVVVVGQKVKKGQILAKKQHYMGMLLSDIKSNKDGVVELIDNKDGWIVIVNNKKEITQKIKYKNKKNVSKDRSLILINSFKIDVVKIYGFENIARLEKYNDDPKKIKSGAYIWVESMKDIKNILEKTNLYKPTGIITAGVDYKDLEEILGNKHRNTAIFSLIIVNGFGKKEFDEQQKRFFTIHSGKYIFSNPSNSTIYTIENVGKFDSNAAPYKFFQYVKLFTFDNWNLNGRVVYNDEDSFLVKTFNNSVVNVSEYNLIKYNHE